MAAGLVPPGGPYQPAKHFRAGGTEERVTVQGTGRRLGDRSGSLAAAKGRETFQAEAKAWRGERGSFVWELAWPLPQGML